MSKIDWSKVVTKEDRETEALETSRQAFIAERSKRLADTDWVILRNLETSEPIPQVWLDYRQALRDMPESVSDYSNVEWPVKPE